jgi:methionyl-tRNA synthetase
VKEVKAHLQSVPHLQSIRVKVSRGGPMARNLREAIAALPAERRAKIAAAHAQKLIAEEQKLIAEKKKWQLEEAKRLMELDHKLIVFAVLPIVAALVWMLTALAVGDQF